MCVGVYLALTFDIDIGDVHLAALTARIYNAALTRITPTPIVISHVEAL